VVLDILVGKKIERIFFNESYLKFQTDSGSFVFYVDGDCCSRSIFYDFIGVKKLLENGRVVSIDSIALDPDDIRENEDGEMQDKKRSDEAIKVYGYRIVTEDPTFGLLSSVFSFRNYSNGYYGGSLEDNGGDRDVQPEIFDDVFETVSE